MLAIKTFIGKSKTNSAKTVNPPPPKWGLSLGPLVIHSDTFLTELTWQVREINFTAGNCFCWICFALPCAFIANFV